MISSMKTSISILLFLVGCCGTGGPYTPDTLAGFWRTVPFTSQLGRSVSEYCFNANGSYVAAFRSDGTSYTDSGTFQVIGNRLILVGSNGRLEYRLEHLDADTIGIKGNDDDQTYNRVGDTCR